MNDKGFRVGQYIPMNDTSKIFNDGKKITHGEIVKMDRKKLTKIKDIKEGDEKTEQLR